MNPDLQACIFLQPQVKLSGRAEQSHFCLTPFCRDTLNLVSACAWRGQQQCRAALQGCTCIDRAIDGHLWDAAGRAQRHVTWQMQIKRSQDMTLLLAFSTCWLNIVMLETAKFLLYSTPHLQC